MFTIPNLGLLAAVVSVVTAYQLGIRRGYALGTGHGYREGKKEGTKEGSMRGYAVGFDRGKRRADDSEEETQRQSWFNPTAVALLVGMAGLFAFGVIRAPKPPAETVPLDARDSYQPGSTQAATEWIPLQRGGANTRRQSSPIEVRGMDERR